METIKMRVAVSQFATTLNTQGNLAACIRMISEAAVCKPNIIVLPEFCNTQPWYVDHNQAWDQALAINSQFLQCIAEQAKKHGCYIALNVTLRRDLERNHQNGAIRSNISVTSCLFSSLGELVQQVDKKTLTGHEDDFFIPADKVAEVITTPFATVGFLTGNDDITFEASRELAFSGAQLLCHSLNSCALDHSEIHGPARAYENNVFLASANKIGSLMPQGLAEEQIERLSLPSSMEGLVGIGQSQILSPEGKILAKVTNNEEGFVFADIDLAETGVNKKSRPDGTALIKQLRSELYQEKMQSNQQRFNHEHSDNVPVTANVAIFATYKSNEQAIEDVCYYIENNLSDIIQLPELFFIADKTITNDAKQLAELTHLSQRLIEQISSVLRPFQYVCTSLVIDGKHQAVLINEQGGFAIQQQLHFCQRYSWTTLGDNLNIIELPLEQGNITVAMLTADDANIPEIVKVAALNNIHLLLVPFDIQEAAEVEFGLLASAAENRICIVAATREKSFADHIPRANSNTKAQHKNKKKVKTQKFTGLIANLTTEPRLSSQWTLNKFTGFINKPLLKHQHGKITKAVIHPVTSCDKLMASTYM